MQEAREEFALVQDKGMYYAIGGSNLEGIHSSIERSDGLEPWKVIANLKIGLKAH